MSFHRANLITLALSLSLVTLAAGSPAFARPDTASNQTKHLELGDAVTVDGTALSPGKYEVVINNGKATFERNGQTVATAGCEWKTLASKPQFDSVVTNKNVLQDVDFAGSTQQLQLK